MGGSLRWLFACIFLASALAVEPARAGDRDLHDGTHNNPEMRRIGRGLFLGPEFIYGKTKSKVGSGMNLPPELRPKAFDVTSSSVGLHTQWDTRDNTFYATSGRLLDFNARVFHDAWGSSFDYEVMEFAYNVYRSIGEDTVIATRLYAKGTFGDVPFFALSQFGKKSDLRGYQAGRWRDRHMYAAQIEIRRRIWKRVGAVAWVGAGGVFNDFDGLFDTVLPSAGVGLRFKLTDQNPINYRIDFAWGHDQATIYFAVGEAF